MAAWSKSQSGITTQWFFAPPSACTLFSFLAAFSYIYFAIGVEPTKLTAWISLFINIASTTSLSPFTTLKTPSGNPDSLNNSARRIEHEGSFSEGFNTKVFPQAIAMGNIHIGTIAGKLNGVIPAQTPKGCLIDQLSIFTPTFSVNSPFKTWGIPQANSTTSKPLNSEPFASS